MPPGSKFVLAMDDAATLARRTIAVLSPAFSSSPFARTEWAAAFREDPTGSDRKLTPVRVRACEPKGLLGSIVYVDLVDVDEGRAQSELLSGVAAERSRPGGARSFPGHSEPWWTGGSARGGGGDLQRAGDDAHVLSRSAGRRLWGSLSRCSLQARPAV